MKPINLLSLVDTSNALSYPIFELYLNNFDTQIKENELEDLKSLVNKMQEESEVMENFEAFYVGYSINQISKEFDLLRFNKLSIINIELKRSNVGEERIKKQLKQNRYYLKFLGRDVFNFTYVVEDEKLFQLDGDEELIESDFAKLISIMNDEEVEYIEEIDKVFDPSKYLVSPFNKTEEFINKEYFLTDQQENIKKDILRLPTNGPCFISIEGSAGTGKTLLTYDIAEEYTNESKNVLIIHCGILNAGHEKLRDDYGWTITPIRKYRDYDLGDFDLIILDETQRIYQNQLDDILEKVMQTNSKCIFSYDPEQCLSNREIRNKTPQHIKVKVSPHVFRLTEKIRTNKEIASFIKNLFDLSKRNPNQKYSNVDIQYFSEDDHARNYLRTLAWQDWKLIKYTPEQYGTAPYEKYGVADITAHQVVGQEFDNVVAVLDRYFFYDNGKLATNYNCPYHPAKMLFQMLTRARKKLRIVIVNNPNVLHECLKILQNQ